MSDVQHTAAADPTPGTTAPVTDTAPTEEAANAQTADASTTHAPAVNVPTAAFKRIKDEARDKGRAEGVQMANQQIADAAKAAGFGSVEEAFAALAALKDTPATRPSSPAVPAGDPQTPATPDDGGAQYAQQLAEAQRAYEAQLAEAKRQHEAAMAKAAELEEALTAKDAEIAIRDTLAKAGVHDTDYAATLLARELAAMDDDELAAFDDSAWVEAQRKARPYLFGQAANRTPATTGVSEGASTPSPEQVAQATAGAGQFDARKAKPTEFADRLRALGLNMPGYGAA